MNGALQTVAASAAHDGQIPSPVAISVGWDQHCLRALDDHLKIVRDATGRAECPLGEVRGNLASLCSREGQDHVAAAVAGPRWPPQGVTVNGLIISLSSCSTM